MPKPYRYSRKLRRYVPKSKSGNRSFYFSLLKERQPDITFDPNSTFGKYVMKKVTPHLKVIRNYHPKSLESDLQYAINHKHDLVKRNKTIFNTRKTKELDTISRRLFNKRHPVLGKILFTVRVIVPDKSMLQIFLFFSYFLIGFCVINKFIEPSKMLLFPVILFIPLYLLSIVNSMIIDRLMPAFLQEAKEELSEEDLIIDLKESEEEAQDRILEQKEKALKSKQGYLKANKKLEEIIENIKSDSFLNFVLSKNFYNSTDWLNLRRLVFNENPNICVKCGSTTNLSVDHIKPRSKFPFKALDKSNLQILCRRCNSSKGNRNL